MSPDILETYRHSGKFSASAVALSCTMSAALAFPLGLGYAYLIRWVPFVYVNVIVTLGYGFCFGWMTTRILKTSKVRNAALAALCGLLAGLFALYGEWSGHIHTLLKSPPWLFRPDQIFQGMRLLYQEGSWSFHDSPVSGIVLAIVWVIEAGMIVGMATLLPFAFVRDTPFCEKSKCWLDEEKRINTLECFTDKTHIASLKTGNIMPLIDAKPKAEGAAVFTRLVLKRSPYCSHFCTLRIQDVSVSIEGDKVKESTENLTGDLIIPATMFDLMMKFEEFKPTPGS